MKTYIYIFLLLFIASACSISDVLEVSDEVNITMMELKEEVTALPGDTVSFTFVASTNAGYLSRLQMVKSHGKFQFLPDSIRFALTDMTDTLYLDEEGYFSRPVKTLMLIYPVAVDSSNHEIGATLGATFMVENSIGKSRQVDLKFKIINFKSYKELWINTRTKWGYPFYNASSNQADGTSYGQSTSFVFAEIDGEKYFMDPAAEETKEYVSKNFLSYSGKPKFDMEKVKPTHTRLMRIDPVDFNSFGDEGFAALDFSQAGSKVKVSDDATVEANDEYYAFQTADGRKGIFRYYIYYGYTYIKVKYEYKARQ